MRLLKRRGKPRIFVQIASYRDPECQWTVKDLFEQALHPERVNVGILWQADKKADKDCFTEASPRPKQTRIIHVKAKESKGVCWARHYAQTLYDDEDYVLMIDSHMRFAKGWDELLIAELRRCPSHKPLLTHYPPGYTPPRTLLPAKLSVMVAQPVDAQGSIRGDGIALETVPDAPLRGAFIAAGFVFAKANLIVEVPYDPYLYFNQEEITMAARLFTKGWDVYHPTIAPIFHYYKKAGDEKHKKLLHWSNDKQWTKLNERGHKRFHHLVGHKLSKDPEIIAEIDHYGLGTKRTLKQFEEFTGINFTKMSVSKNTTKGLFIHDIEKWKQPSAVNVPALIVGDYLPPFALDNRGAVVQVANARTMLFFLPLDFPGYLRDFFDYYAKMSEAIAATKCPQLLIVNGTAEEAAALKKKFSLTATVAHDTAGHLQRHFGLGDNARIKAISVLVNANQKILGVYDNSNATNQLADALRAMHIN